MGRFDNSVDQRGPTEESPLGILVHTGGCLGYGRGPALLGGLSRQQPGEPGPLPRGPRSCTI